MPIALAAGIPWFASLIAGLFASLVTYFLKFFTKKVAVLAAVITLVLAAVVTFVAFIESLVSGLVYVFPNFSHIGLFLPDNYSGCMSAIVTGKIAHWAYGWNIRIIQYKLAL